MTELEHRLNKLLYRTSCSSSIELGEYHLGLLPNDREKAIRQHLADCPYCTAEVNQLKAFLREVGPDLEYSLTEKIQIWIAERVPDFPASGQMPPSFALRGGDKAPQVFTAGEAEITVEYERDPSQTGQGTLLGLLSGVDPSGIQAALWQDEKKISSAVLDDLGNFILTNIESGRYQLIFAGEILEIHLDNLEI